jgi:tetratricopeptide (TPR) repeat protein
MGTVFFARDVATGDHGSILLADATTASLVEGRFATQPLGPGARVLTERPSEGFRRLLGQPSVCVGRERELAQLRHDLALTLSERRARAAVVLAPAGVGKSRLRHEVVSSIDRSRIEVWSMRPEPFSQLSSFAMVGALVRRLAGVLPGDTDEIRWMKLRARAEARVPARMQGVVAEILAEIASAGSETSPGGRAQSLRDAALMWDRIRSGFTAFVGAELEARPLVIVAEDVHEADQPSLDLLGEALRVHDERALFVLGLGRPEARRSMETALKGRRAEAMVLLPLTDAAATTLVRAALGPRGAADVVAGIVTRAAGNAFFLEELVRAVAAGESVLPASVAATLEARIEVEPDETRRALCAASVFGGRFWQGGVAALVGRADVQAEIDRLADAELIVSRPDSRITGEREYAFRHPIVADVAYAMLPAEDRAASHAAAARFLEDNGETDAAVLAAHLERCGDPRRAISYWCRAVQQAHRAHDLHAVVRIAERALAADPDTRSRGELELALADAYTWRGDNTEARAHAKRALAALPEHSAAWCFALRISIASAARMGERHALDESLSAVFDMPMGGAHAADRIVLVATAVIQLVHQGRLDVADELLERIDPTRLGACAPRHGRHGRRRAGRRRGEGAAARARRSHRRSRAARALPSGAAGSREDDGPRARRVALLLFLGWRRRARGRRRGLGLGAADGDGAVRPLLADERVLSSSAADRVHAVGADVGGGVAELGLGQILGLDRGDLDASLLLAVVGRIGGHALIHAVEHDVGLFVRFFRADFGARR